MKFEYLREFVAAAQSDELSHAAEKLGISQSTLSKHIKAIELELGEELFVRARRTVLSQYGRIMLPYAKEICALQDEYTAEFRCGKESTGELVIGLSSIQLREAAGKTIDEFMFSNPAVSVRLAEAGNSELAESVKSGKCDVAFIRSQAELVRDPELVYFPFRTDRMVAFLPPEHTLAGKDCISFSDLRAENILLRTEKSAVYRVTVSECRKLEFEPKITFAGSYTLYDMVRRGEGLTLYLAPPASDEYETPLAIVPIEPSVVSFVDLVFRSDNTNSNLWQFLQFVHPMTPHAPDGK